MNVVITGASSGIGRALARIFAREGHVVLAVARREERLLALCQEMAEARAATVHALALDLTSEGALQVLYEEAIRVLEDFRGPEVIQKLPSAPPEPILVRREIDRPQPRRDRNANGGMSVTVGRVRPCPLLDLRMVSVVHNTLRGAASGSILNAELLVAEGIVK